MARNMQHATLGVISFGLAVGVTCGVFTLVLGIAASLLGWGATLAVALSDLFVGFGPSFVGVISGMVWGFADGFVAGLLIAWLYNSFLLRRQGRTTESSR